jgi:hypothetical protein
VNAVRSENIAAAVAVDVAIGDAGGQEADRGVYDRAGVSGEDKRRGRGLPLGRLQDEGTEWWLLREGKREKRGERRSWR